jgi:hypothetical protein
MATDGPEDRVDRRNWAPKRAAEKHYQSIFDSNHSHANAQISKKTPHQVRTGLRTRWSG